jgi:hypothetical protein
MSEVGRPSSTCSAIQAEFSSLTELSDPDQVLFL